MTLLRQDRALLLRFREGDPTALERVFRYYVDGVSTAVRRGAQFKSGARVGGVPAHDVVDLVQEVFVRAFSPKARLAYDGLRDYGPYLLTIARNLLADWAAKRGREVVGLDDDYDAIDEQETSEAWATPEVQAAVEAYVRALKPPLDRLYELRFAQGLSQADAAQALGIGRQVLRTLEKRLREGLAAALEMLG